MVGKSLKDWLSWLETLHPQEIELGLERVASVAQNLGLLPLKAKVITVAGTNGKGSTIAALESMLSATGCRVGAYTSPHIISYSERIRVNGKNASEGDICAAFDQVEKSREDTPLTYFEYGTLAALQVFSENDLDFLLLEVGLGGRLDAVNIVSADISVITSIDIDHTDWLGSDREQIAIEKAGVLRSGKIFVCGDNNPPVQLQKISSQLDCECYWFERDFCWRQREDTHSWEGRDIEGKTVCLPNLPSPQLLPANIATAIQVLCLAHELPSVSTLSDVLTELNLPGRQQRLEQQGIEYILDVSHNPAATRVLADYLAVNPASGRTVAVFAAMSDKDIRGMIQALTGSIEAWFIADLPKVSRAASSEELTIILRECGIQMISVNKNPRQALRRAQSLLDSGDRLVVFGSFLTVSEVMVALEKDSKKGAQ